MHAPQPVRALLRAAYAFAMLRARTTTQPADAPEIRSGDPLADRVLLIASGVGHGWGVPSHRAALTGQLARSIGARTDRGCDVERIGAEAMSIRGVLSWIGDRDLSPVDGVVLALGTGDSLRLMPVRIWERELERLLDALDLRLRGEARILLVGIPPMTAVGAYTGVLARLTDRHRERLNDVTHHVASRRGLPYLDLPAREAGPTPEHAAEAYHEFAEQIATELAPRIAQLRPHPVPRGYPGDVRWDWEGAAAVVELARTGGDERLQQLAETAQRSFGVELAVVSLADGDRTYHAVNTDVLPVDVPRELSFCRYTVERGEPVVIPDSGRDPRFDDNPLVDMSFIRFYAGYPLRASDGRVIGSFCLQGSRPRRQSAVALDLLRQLALQAEAVLHDYETPRPAVPPAQRSEAGQR